MNDTLLHLRERLAAFSRGSVITLLASLNTFPENHSQRQRLTAALQAVVDMSEPGGDRQILPAELSAILAEVFVPGTDDWNREDPAEVLFTEVFLFHGGNFILFPEVFADSLNGLRNLADTVFMTENKFPKAFKEDIFFALSALFEMSNEIAEKMGYVRYKISPNRHREEIFFAYPDEQSRSIDAIKFRYNDILKPGLTGVADREQILSYFTCQPAPRAMEEDDYMKAPIQTKPLYRDGDYLLVINLQGICSALVHFIIVKVHQYNILNDFIEEYQQLILERVRGLLKRIDFTEIEELPPVSRSHPLFRSELLYRFDGDKLAWVTLIPDLFKSYNTEMFFTIGNEFVAHEDLHRRKGTAKEYIETRFPGHELLFIDIFVPVGREYRVSVGGDDYNQLQLSFSDLRDVTYHDLGADGLIFWRYFLALKEYAAHGQIQAFSFLDRYAFYKDHRDSFYLSDEVRYPNFMIEIGYANEFREEAHNKTDTHLVPLMNGLAEIEKRFHHREISIYLPNEPTLLPRQYILGSPLSFWVHIRFRQRRDPIIRDTAWMLMESCSYWLWEVNAEFQKAFENAADRVIPYEFELMDEEQWADYNFDKTQTPELVSRQFRAQAMPTHITISVPFQLAYLINGVNNDNDRVLLHWLFIGFNQYLTIHKINKRLDVDVLVEKYAPKGKKTMMQGFDTLKNPMLHPHQLPGTRFVEDFEIELLLDDLANKAAPAYPVGDLANAKEKNKVSNLIVSHYFEDLKKLIGAFDYIPLLKQMIAMNESLWRHKHMSGNKSTSRLACFGRVASMRDEIIDEQMEIEEATLALRCLTEIIAALSPSGKKPPNNRDFDHMLALMKEIVIWGTISDELNFGVNEIEMGILPSGRMGTGKEFLNKALRPYNLAKKNEAIDERIVDDELRAATPEPDTPAIRKAIEKSKEDAFEAEFGFNWSTYLDMLITLVDLGYDSKDGIIIREESEIIKEIQSRYPLTDTIVKSFLDQFSLESRTQWEILPEGYKLADVYPWRYSRALSLMRKPLIKVESEGKVFYYWGMRQALLSWQYVGDLIKDGRFFAKSAEMKSYISSLLDKKGKRFTAEVYTCASTQLNKERYIVDREVKIAERGKLVADKNYGDIDILIIDRELKKIISVECKHITPARITSEFASELKKFESEWIGKHTKRHKWLVSHIEDVKAAYKLPQDQTLEVKSIFLTSEKVPFPFITKNYKSLPFFDFGSWARTPTMIDTI
jgi:hypothetical protein